MQVIVDVTMQLIVNVTMQVIVGVTMQLIVGVTIQVIVNVIMQVIVNVTMQLIVDVTMQVIVDVTMQVIVDVTMQVIVDVTMQVIVDVTMQVIVDVTMQLIVDVTMLNTVFRLSDLPLLPHSGADLYQKALNSGLDVFRATEHALTVRWHERDCRSGSLAKEEQVTCEVEEKHLHLAASVSLEWIKVQYFHGSCCDEQEMAPRSSRFRSNGHCCFLESTVISSHRATMLAGVTRVLDSEVACTHCIY